MGLCQGRSCQRLVTRILANALLVPAEQVLIPSYRPSLHPVALETLCSGETLDLEEP